MSVIDDWAERHIQEALNNGELVNLKGEGEPLLLDDDSQIPPELRAGFRILKNSGYLPPELQYRKDALSLVDMLRGLTCDYPNYISISKQLALLELKLKQANVNTDFLHGEYETHIDQHFNRDKRA